MNQLMNEGKERNLGKIACANKSSIGNHKRENLQIKLILAKNRHVLISRYTIHIISYRHVNSSISEMKGLENMSAVLCRL